MDKNSLICPHCHKEIALTEAMTVQIEEKVKFEYEMKLKENERQWEARIEATEKSISEKLKERYEKEFEDQLKSARLEAEKKASQKMMNEIKEKDDEIGEMNVQIEKYRKKEISLLKKEKELAEEKHAMEVKFQEKLNKETMEVHRKAREEAEEEFGLKFAEKEKTIKDLHKQLMDAQKKAEQGSMQLQGEVQELEIEALLKKYFPEDEITPVKTGQKGGDIIHTVRTKSGHTAGKILWESKRTKNWSDQWLDKIKTDMRKSQCDLCAIISAELPSEINSAGQKDGVWIAALPFTLGLATALRENLKSVHMVKQSQVNQTDKMSLVYDYLTGNHFKNRVEAIIEVFTEMKNDLDSERRAFEKIWSKRDKQIERFLLNMSGMYGDLQGYGAVLPNINLLELPE